MKNYKLKMELVNDEEKVVGAVIIDCSQIKTLDESFGVSALNEAYNVLLNDLKNEKHYEEEGEERPKVIEDILDIINSENSGLSSE